MCNVTGRQKAACRKNWVVGLCLYTISYLLLLPALEAFTYSFLTHLPTYRCLLPAYNILAVPHKTHYVNGDGRVSLRPTCAFMFPGPEQFRERNFLLVHYIGLWTDLCPHCAFAICLPLPGFSFPATMVTLPTSLGWTASLLVLTIPTTTSSACRGSPFFTACLFPDCFSGWTLPVPVLFAGPSTYHCVQYLPTCATSLPYLCCLPCISCLHVG